MKSYTVVNTEGVTINTGILGLNEKQAAARKGQVEPLGDGLFEIKQPVMFKCGEIFEFDGDVNRSLALNIVEAEPVAKKGRK